MGPLHNRGMAEKSQEQAVDRDAVDPYGDVPLGVECAWPQSLPAAQAMASDAHEVPLRFQL